MTYQDDDTQATPTGSEGEDAEGHCFRRTRTEDAPVSSEGDDAEGEASSGEGEDAEGHAFKRI